MFPYYLLVFFPLLCSFLFSSKDKQKGNRIGIVLFFVILCLLLILRDESVGCDLIHYHAIFNDIQYYSFKETLLGIGDYEPLFLLYTRICGLISNDFQFYLAITALLSVFPVAWFYRKETESVVLTIALFLVFNFFRFYFSGIRQGLAILFAVPAFVLCSRKKIIPFIMIVIVASFMHRTALLMLFMYPLYHLKLNKKALFLVLISVLIVFLFKEQLFRLIIPFMDERYQEVYGEIEVTNAYMMSLLLLLLVVFSFVVADESKLDKDTKAMRNFLVLAAILQQFSSVNSVAMRINYYYLLFIPILIPKIIHNSNPNLKAFSKISGFVMSIFFIFYYFLGALTGEDIVQMYPYIPFW